ncbi:pyridoxamine 5'-phosphate oxidase family protein [Sulfitobacter albidus]|uniref:Pyridoxamine 5'-phosphate oxidase family protein n=1 Tax=Sulfitobacter albidus TaxID=2829501 RepID=A0A975PKX1_9RHOB|nr:pyridoxamine 5'-phosphate oxidase family protein [Sulfitobacter albidus]QUJ75064.1 pyridoxamine 5'-phosphate oxidase family protein [Sulfitobacter albidus]
MSDTLKEEFYDRLEEARAGMLSANGAPAVPMSHYADDDGGPIWFITAKGTDLAKSAQTSVPAQYQLASAGEGLYARVDGSLVCVEDPAQLDRLWNAIAAAWFEGGKQDPDVQLMRFDPREAEVWTTGGTAQFLYEVAKSHLTDEKPDMGRHGTITF